MGVNPLLVYVGRIVSQLSDPEKDVTGIMAGNINQITKCNYSVTRYN